MVWETTETAITAALYSVLGNAVTYTSQAQGALSINVILNTSSTLFGPVSQTAEDITTARVNLSDVTTPQRGDTIENSAGATFIVDAVDQENNVEWLLTLTVDEAYLAPLPWTFTWEQFDVLTWAEFDDLDWS